MTRRDFMKAAGLAVPAAASGQILQPIVSGGLRNLLALRPSGLWTFNNDGGLNSGSWWEPDRNLLAWSEDFSNAAWNKSASSVSGQALIESAATAEHAIYQDIALVATTYTFWVEAKPNGRDMCALNIFDGSGHITWFYLSGAGSTGTNAAGNTSTIEAIDDGYYRVSISRIVNAGTSPAILYIAQSDGSTSYAGDGSSGLLVRKAQLNPGATPATYAKTEAKQRAWDWSGNARHLQRGSAAGSDTNDPSIAVEGGYSVSWGFATDDYGDSALTSGAAFTMLLVFKAASLQIATPLTNTETDDISTPGASLKLRSDGSAWYRVVDGSGISTLELTAQYSAGTWGCLGFSYDGSSIRAYKNGLLSGSPLSAIRNTTSALGLRVGAYRGGAGEAYSGNIALVAAYAKALTDADIARVYREIKTRFAASRGITLP